MTESGMYLRIAGQKTPSSPNCQWIADPGASPTSIYSCNVHVDVLPSDVKTANQLAIAVSSDGMFYSECASDIALISVACGDLQARIHDTPFTASYSGSLSPVVSAAGARLDRCARGAQCLYVSVQNLPAERTAMSINPTHGSVTGGTRVLVGAFSRSRFEVLRRSGFGGSNFGLPTNASGTVMLPVNDPDDINLRFGSSSQVSFECGFGS